MKAAAFDYLRPAGVADVLRALRDDPEAKVIAGGQSLVPMMNLRLAQPALLIDIGGLTGLDRVFEDVDSLLVGALVRHRRIEREPVFTRRTPLLAEVARHIGHIGIRNRGTLGGTLAHADPAAELPLAMVTLRATVHVESIERGRREIEADAFFSSFFTTTLADDELVTWIRVPTLRDGQGWGFTEFARRHGDFALAGAAAVLDIGPDGGLRAVRAALLSAGDRPLVVSRDLPDGTRPDADLWRDAADTWTRDLPDGEDAGYSRRLARTALFRALTAAQARAAGEGT